MNVSDAQVQSFFLRTVRTKHKIKRQAYFVCSWAMFPGSLFARCAILRHYLSEEFSFLSLTFHYPGSRVSGPQTAPVFPAPPSHKALAPDTHTGQRAARRLQFRAKKQRAKVHLGHHHA